MKDIFQCYKYLIFFINQLRILTILSKLKINKKTYIKILIKYLMKILISFQIEEGKKDYKIIWCKKYKMIDILKNYNKIRNSKLVLSLFHINKIKLKIQIKLKKIKHRLLLILQKILINLKYVNLLKMNWLIEMK